METEQSIEQLFEVFATVKRDLDQQSRSLNEGIRGIQLIYLESLFQEQQNALADCLSGFDQQLLALSEYFGNYFRLYASLNDLNQKIVGLGGEPRVIPEAFVGDNLAASLIARVNQVKSQARI